MRAVEVRRILCPSDLSEASAHAVEQAVSLAAYYQSRITALHVMVPPYPPADGPLLDDRLAEVAEFFNAATATGTGVDVEVETGFPVSRVIVERALRLPADMIVMGTHGASGFERLVLGSVTEKVLRTATCPVLTVPPRQHATSRLPFRRLLCAVDFSGASLAAAQFAFSVAGESGAALTLLHVLEWPWDEPPPPAVDELPPPQAAALLEYRRYLEATAKSRLDSLVSDRARTPVTTCVRNGKAHVQILDVAASQPADLIIVGVRGRNPIDMMLLGSTTNQIVRRATCPVLTLR